MERHFTLCAIGDSVSPMFKEYVNSEYYLNFMKELTTPIQEFVVLLFMISFFIWIVPITFKCILELVFIKQSKPHEKLQRLFTIKK